MLRRSLFTALLCTLVAVPSSAQRFAVGATGGLRLVQSSAPLANQGYLVGFGVGGVVSYAVAPRVTVRAEVLYADFGRQVLAQDDSLGQTPSGQDAYIRVRDRQLAKYIDVPVMVRYQLPASPDGRVKVHFGLGVATAFRATCTIRTDTEYISVEDRQVLYSEFSDAACVGDTGSVLLSLLGSFGGQYEVGKARLFADARYGYGFSRAAAGSDGKLRQISVAAGLAYAF